MDLTASQYSESRVRVVVGELATCLGAADLSSLVSMLYVVDEIAAQVWFGVKGVG